MRQQKRTDGCPSCEQLEVKPKRIPGVMVDALPGAKGE